MLIERMRCADANRSTESKVPSKVAILVSPNFYSLQDAEPLRSVTARPPGSSGNDASRHLRLRSNFYLQRSSLPSEVPRSPFLAREATAVLFALILADFTPLADGRES